MAAIFRHPKYGNCFIVQRLPFGYCTILPIGGKKEMVELKELEEIKKKDK
jgi:hypothetical protein